jgi:hypothetical protein
MAHTFHIRFARNSGLAALLEAPANSFHWKGSGRLSIDNEWLVFARSRQFPWSFGRLLRRVPAAALAGVYREGDSLRLEFSGSPRLVVPIWARDHQDAAEIVRLMPTDRTVELDGVSPQAKPASSRRVGIVLVAVVSLIVGVLARSMFENREAIRELPAAAMEVTPASIPEIASSPSIASTGAAKSAASLGAGADAAASPAMRLATPATQVDSVTGEFEAAPDTQPTGSNALHPSTSIAPGEQDNEAAVPRSDFFRAESAALQSEYVYGRTSTADLERRWWALSVRLYNSPEFDDWRLRPLIDAQLGVSLNWRISLSNYDAAINSGNQTRIDAARADLENANELTNHVQSFSY